MNVRKQAEAIASGTLAQCAAEVLSWRKTGVLPPGSALHKVAAIWSTESQYVDDSLQMAEQTVIKLALQSAAEARGKDPDQ